MRTFSSGLSHYLILKSKASLLVKDKDISWLVVYIQQVERLKKKQSVFSER